ncbi:uncharacterized protein LOC129608148 [Condylostylus longicornis]|uniref:uncharacterized protein LOC129608148 n=1 Tax=Condylostylus longicornis TaxID=2530218 RepID=UPI00244DE30D|nr:uncharacterized protein LOC129608148 [Condylostylus longicornis]
MKISSRRRSQNNDRLNSRRFNNNNGDNISYNSSRRNNNNNNNPVTRCELPILNNGDVKLRHRGKLIRFVCNKSFFLIGNTYAACGNNGKWDIDIPVCVKRGCSRTLETPVNGFITYERSNSIAHLYCENGYSISFGRISYCNGTTWDRPIGKCRKINNKKNLQRFCDFETEDICGWQQDDYDDFEWKRTTGVNIYKRIRTGPQHDHTTLKSYDGHYMLIESINRLSLSYARLISPIYPRNYSINSCFRFWYHMYGTTVGSLKVYVKPLSIDIDSLQDNIETSGSFLHWEKSYNQGNHWYEAVFLLEELQEDFQIIFEGTTGAGHLSDIAIDDVALLLGNECYLLEQTSTTPTNTNKIKYETELTTDINNEYTTEDKLTGALDEITCTNRCNETESIVNKSTSNIERINNTNDFIMICDCHFGCQEIETCCLDYKRTCLTFEFTKDEEEQTENFETTIETQTFGTTTEFMTTVKLITDSRDNITETQTNFNYKKDIVLSTKPSNFIDHPLYTTVKSSLSDINMVETTSNILLPSTTRNSVSQQNSYKTNIPINTELSAITFPTTWYEQKTEIQTSTNIREIHNDVEAFTNEIHISTENSNYKKSSQFKPTISSTSTSVRSPEFIPTSSSTSTSTNRITTTIQTPGKLPAKKNVTSNETSKTGNRKGKNNISSLTILIVIILTIIIFLITFTIGLLCSNKLKKFNSKKIQIKYFNRKNKKTTPLLQNNNADYNNVRYLINDDELDFTLQTIELPTNNNPKENLLTPSSSKSFTMLPLTEKYENTETKEKIADSKQIGNTNSNVDSVASKSTEHSQMEIKTKEPSKKKVRKSFNNSKKSQFDDNNEKNQLIPSDVSNDECDICLQ